MDIVICGAGEVGTHSAEVLAARGHNITVIDELSDRLTYIEETLDVGVMKGNCGYAETLVAAGVPKADLVITATSHDEVNLLTATISKSLGATQVIARVHHATYFEQRSFDYRKQLGIDQLICPEYSAAQAIARTLRNPGALAIENFARGRIEMQEFRVSPNARAVEKRLRELELPAGVRIAAITRNQYMFIPEANTVITPDDSIVLVGNTETFQESIKLFTEDGFRRQRIVLFGGQAMAVWLCRALRAGNFSIRLFEETRKVAEDLAERLDWVTVINANPTDPMTFDEEHLEQTDAFVSLADDDEQNILGCAWAKSMGVPKVIAVVQRPNYLHLLGHVGIDKAFSPRQVAVREIESILDDSTIRKIASLGEQMVDVYRARVNPDAPLVNKPLKEIKLTPDWMIAAIQTGERVHVPGADDSLKPGDHVLLIGRHGTESKLSQPFAL